MAVSGVNISAYLHCTYMYSHMIPVCILCGHCMSLATLCAAFWTILVFYLGVLLV